MENKIKQIVSDVTGEDIENISVNHSLMNDLGADSLDFVEIIMEVEKIFNISISDEILEDYTTTVQDLIYIVKELEVKPKKVKSKKTVKKRVIKFVETTYDDGSITVRPRTRGFNDFELVGLLSYYQDLFKVQMIQKCNTGKQ